MRCAFLVALLAALGCKGRDGPAPGQLLVTWSGHASGRFSATLRATHCPTTGVVELLAIRGDTGVGGALFLRDSTSLGRGDFPVFLAATHPEPRPGAVAALRWFNLTSIVVYEGLSGIIHLDRGDSTLSGTFDVKLQGLDNPDTLRLRGRFDRVPVAPGDSSCSATMRRNIL